MKCLLMLDNLFDDIVYVKYIAAIAPLSFLMSGISAQWGRVTFFLFQGKGWETSEMINYCKIIIALIALRKYLRK